MMPGFSFAAANPWAMKFSLAWPQYFMWPSLNFSVLCLAPVSFPAMTTWQPLAPDSMILRTVECPALLERVRELLSHYLGVQVGVLDLLNLDLRVVELEILLNRLREALDGLS